MIGGFHRPEKYEFVNGKDDNQYMKWKVKNLSKYVKLVSVCQCKCVNIVNILIGFHNLPRCVKIGYKQVSSSTAFTTSENRIPPIPIDYHHVSY